jgi:hypothetical protein
MSVNVTLAQVPPAVVSQFRALAERWREETAFLSSSTAMAAHPAYQAIIALGPPVVPLILRDLERQPDHWFDALKAITGEDPVSPQDWGRVRAMADAWLAWGRSRGNLGQTPAGSPGR